MLADAIRRAVEALNQGDRDGYGAAFHPDAERTVPGVQEPLPASVVLDVLAELQTAFEGFRLDPLLLLESGDHVVARWRTTGTHTGSFQGLAPTGRRFETESCEVYVFRDGKVARSWSYGDPSEMTAQLLAGETTP